MRIALLSYEYPPETGFGGIATYTYYHARALARLGHAVHVFAGSTRAERRSYDDAGITVTRFRKVGPVERLLPRLAKHELWWFQNRVQTAANAYAAVQRELSRRSYDVFEMPECGADGALLTQLHNLPGVVRLHSPAALIMPTYPSRRLDRALTAMVERIGMNGARAISSCSSWLAREVRQRMGIDRPIEVIPNGIELGMFDEDEGIDITSRFGVPKDGVRIFFANRIETRKGIEVVQEVAAQLLPRYPNASLVLAGRDDGGYMERSFWPRMREIGVDKQVHHLGGLKPQEVRACLKQTDIFLLASIWENAPYSLLEAMSAGRAIVASDCGGIPEMLRHEVDGLVARTGDPTSFRRALERLLDAESLRQRFGRSARQRVESRYTAEHVAHESLDFYAWALRAPVAFLAPGAKLPELQVGPTNWFQAWWLRGSRVTEHPVLARDGKGQPRLAGLSLTALAFVERILARGYWDGPGGGGTRETQFLDEVSRLLREKALAAQAAGQEPAATETLAFPALTHPLFGDDLRGTAVVDELWRVADAPECTAWLTREIGQPDFVERASRRPLLRELATQLARRQPSPESFEVLRRIYRTVAHHARVVKQDQEWFAEQPRGQRLAEHVAHLGLHAPLKRPNYPSAKAPSKPSDAPATVTVLIPSYKHESYVVGAIRSALDQDAVAVRVAVVDDQSPDGTVAAARNVDDPRVSVRVNERNFGLGESIRRALEAIDTPWVALLNSDDLFHPQRLRKLLAAADGDDQAQVLASDIGVIDAEGRRLTAETCAGVDHGMRVLDWLRWYERVSADAAEHGSPADFKGLLRHNHLATSSNLLCRTEWLRQHAAIFCDLAYCVDWMVFLAAAAEGALRHVGEDLLGYRLHEANTVWFESHSREGYWLEVNQVVARALRLWRERVSTSLPPEQVASETAELLEQHVAAHGETEGTLLFLLAQNPDTSGVRLGATPAGVSAARAAARRKELARDLAATDLPAWRIAEQLRQRDALRLAADSVDALRPRLQWLEAEVQRLSAEVHRTGQHDADGRAWRDRFEEITAEATATRTRLEASLADLDRCSRETLAAHVESDRRERDALLAAHADELNRLRGEADAARAAAEQEQARIRAEAEARVEQVRARATAELAALIDSNERSNQGWRRLETDIREWAGKVELRRRQELALAQESLETRVGRAVLDKLALRGPAKTLQRLLRRSRLWWGRSRLRRWGADDRFKVALIAPDLPGEDGELMLIADGEAMLATGCNPLLLSWRGSREGSLGSRTELWQRHQHRLTTDAKQARLDSAFWQELAPERFAEVRDELNDPGLLDRACVAARSLHAFRPNALLAVGAGRTARLAAAAAHLLQAPLALAVDPIAALELRQADGSAARLLEHTKLVITDNRPSTDTLRQVLVGTQVLWRQPRLALRRQPPPATNQLNLVAFGPIEEHGSWYQVLDAIAELRDRGLLVTLDILLAERHTSSGLVAADRLRWHVTSRRLDGHVRLHATHAVDHLEAVVSSAHAALVPIGTGTTTASWPTALGFSAGANLPTVTLGTAEGTSGPSVAGDDPRAVADAAIVAARGQAPPDLPPAAPAWIEELRAAVTPGQTR